MTIVECFFKLQVQKEERRMVEDCLNISTCNKEELKK